MDGDQLVRAYGLPPLHLVRHLTKRQLQMLGLLASGMDKADIAKNLRLERSTVYTTFNDAHDILARAAKHEGHACPECMTTPMWVRWGVLLGLDIEIVPRPINPSRALARGSPTRS